MRTAFLAGLALLAGCSAPMDQRVENATEAAANTTEATPDDDASMATNATGEDLNAAANAAGNASANAQSNVTTFSGPAFCPILKRIASAADCAAITAQADNLAAGLGAFNAPAAMVMNEPQTVKFAVGAAGEIAETTERAGGIIAKSIIVPTKIGRYMTARLSGGGFKIEADGAPERDLGASNAELWTWQVTPERKGKLELLLTVSVEAADAAGKRTRIKLSTKAVPVEVSVTKADQARAAAEQSIIDADLAAKVSKSWAAFFTNLALAITALAGLIGAIWYFKIRKPGETPPPAPPKDKDGPKP